MPRLLTLSRAARLVGVRRGALQGKIRSGELAAFEGMVSAQELLRAYPGARLEDNTALERTDAIKDAAFSRRLREHLLPNTEVLAARLAEIGRERAQDQRRLGHYREIVAQLQAKLREPGDPAATSRALAAELLAWLAERLEPVADAEEPQPLLAEENILRIMTAHVRIEPSGRDFLVDGNDNLLEAALRAGLALDYGCSAGSCGKCKARILSGQVHRTRHSDYALTEAEKGSGVVLMCCHAPVGDLVIEAREAHGAADMPRQTLEARVKSVKPLAEGLLLLHLQTPRSQRLRFLAGQSVSLSLPGGPSVSYPLASCPCDDRNLQFHIARRAGDAFAERAFHGLKVADTVRVEGPRGDFVLDEKHRPLIFIAFETGFAPIKSLIEHAMALDAAETLGLYWIASGNSGHYLDNLCRSWSDAFDNFGYVPLTAPTHSPPAQVVQDLVREMLRNHPRLEDFDVYVAGAAPLADETVRLLLERGMAHERLFVHAPES